MEIFSRFFFFFFSVNLKNVFSKENLKFYFKSWTLQGMSRTTKHVRKGVKGDPGDRVTLPVKFACN